MKIIATALTFMLLSFSNICSQAPNDYTVYHKTVLEAEELVIKEDFDEALDLIDGLSKQYDFVFLKEYKIAAQIALHIGDVKRAYGFLKSGIIGGWTLKEIKKEAFLKPLLEMEAWQIIRKEYETLRQAYLNRSDHVVKEEVYAMYRKDQKFAFKYLFRFGQKAKERFGNKKGAPHTKEQMKKLARMLESKGYPGEKLIGEEDWMSTILSHHNSIAKDFVVQDTLFISLRPALLNAVSKGEMNPYQLAFIEDWRIAVKTGRKEAGFGYLDVPSKDEVTHTNALRNNLNIRSIESRNALVDLQDKTGMEFYLTGYPWVDGKIVPVESHH